LPFHFVYLNKTKYSFLPKTSSILPRLFQIFICFISLLSIYMLLAILDNDEADLMNEIDLFVIQPIIGSVLVALTIIICFIVGLPIRLIARVKNWLVEKPVIPLIGLAFGVIFFLMAFYPNLMEQKEVLIDGGQKLKQVPNYNLSLTGWFIIGFSLLHFYPDALLQYIKRKLLKSESL
jgi:hypothetical protein